ncbi:hypothetical protein GCM10010170_039230 [Dactylosporangium salmoneum]|uniref:Uncharacterized protein n=1 Tax=Dactylosporangium salmoneum TaxID=53361 RepID=A0ABP5THK5_9ACTN
MVVPLRTIERMRHGDPRQDKCTSSAQLVIGQSGAHLAVPKTMRIESQPLPASVRSPTNVMA